MNLFKLPSSVQSYRHIEATSDGVAVRHRITIALICALTLVVGFVLIGMSRVSDARSAAADPKAAQNLDMTDPRNANIISAMTIERGRLARGAESPTPGKAVAAPSGNVVDMTY